MAKFDENKEETGLVPVEKRTEEIREEAFPEKKKRLNRKERKALKKRQWEYEKQLVKEGKIARRFRYVPRNSFARILSVCLAFVIGFFGAFGALAGGFAYAGTKAKVNDLLKIADVNTSEIVTEYAAQKSVLDLVTEVADLFKGFRQIHARPFQTARRRKRADQGTGRRSRPRRAQIRAVRFDRQIFFRPSTSQRRTRRNRFKTCGRQAEFDRNLSLL